MKKITHHYKDGIHMFTKTIEIQEEERETIGEFLIEPKLSDMVYENNIQTIMKLLINSLKNTKQNILLFGSAGTGKTTTAKMLACESGRPFVYLTGSMGHKKITDLLLEATEKAIILIDEIHNLPEKVAEIIYPAVQDGEIYLHGKREILKDLVFIGTTTDPYQMPLPLRARFKQIELEELSKEKLKEVLLKKGCEEKSANVLLRFSTNMRIINNLLDMVRLYGEVNENNVLKVFKLKGINSDSGLSNIQEEYLKVLRKTLKMGVRNLSILLNRSEDYIKFEVEPDLIRKGFVIVTSRGREISPDYLAS